MGIDGYKFIVVIVAISFLLWLQYVTSEEGSGLRLIYRPMQFLLIAGLLLLGIRTGDSLYYIAGIASLAPWIIGYGATR